MKNKAGGVLAPVRNMQLLSVMNSSQSKREAMRENQTTTSTAPLSSFRAYYVSHILFWQNTISLNRQINGKRN